MTTIKYTVDIVLCVDATGSMDPIIEDVKRNAKKFYKDLFEIMNDKQKLIDTLRVKVVVFRDFYNDGENAIKVSDFFNLPEQNDSFETFVDEIIATGGGDEPENGLEALAVAMNSDWNKIGDRKRQVIVVWTDASCHELEKFNTKPSNYPVGLPSNFDELTDWWEGQDKMNPNAKRLIIYAPDAYAWSSIASYWSNTVMLPSKGGKGLEEYEYKEILNTIANSI